MNETIIQANPGETIYNFANRLFELAQEDHAALTAVFNDTEFPVHQFDTPYHLVERWDYRRRIEHLERELGR